MHRGNDDKLNEPDTCRTSENIYAEVVPNEISNYCKMATEALPNQIPNNCDMATELVPTEIEYNH